MIQNKFELAKHSKGCMGRRVRYDWNWKDFLFNSFRIFSCLFCCIKNRPMNVKNRLRFYDKGEQKFIKEFDALTFAKSIRNLNNLVEAMLDDDEKIMVKYQKVNVITPESDSEHEDKQGKEEVPKLFSQKQNKEVHTLRISTFMVRYFLK